MMAWNVQHITHSLRYPRSNGLAESMVKSVKKTIKKCLRSKQDVYMGLLILHNSPLNCELSPAQLLMNHKLQDDLPKFHVLTLEASAGSFARKNEIKTDMM